MVNIYNTGYKSGRWFLLAVFLAIQILVSPFLGMFFATVDYARAWIGIVFQIVGFVIGLPLRLVGQILEYIMDAVWYVSFCVVCHAHTIRLTHQITERSALNCGAAVSRNVLDALDNAIMGSECFSYLWFID